MGRPTYGGLEKTIERRKDLINFVIETFGESKKFLERDLRNANRQKFGKRSHYYYNVKRFLVELKDLGIMEENGAGEYRVKETAIDRYKKGEFN